MLGRRKPGVNDESARSEEPRAFLSDESSYSTNATSSQNSHDPSRKRVESLLDMADIVIDGTRPDRYARARPRLYARILAHGSLGFGEAYMDGWWDAEDLDGFLFLKLLDARISDERVGGLDDAALYLRAAFSTCSAASARIEVGERPLRSRQRSVPGDARQAARLQLRLLAGRATDLDEAQEAKLDLICRKLGLAPGMRVLDIGCGWGEALKIAAERYGVSAASASPSRRNRPIMRATSCRGLPIEIRLAGLPRRSRKNSTASSRSACSSTWASRTTARISRSARRCLPTDGLFVLHTIGSERVDATTPIRGSRNTSSRTRCCLRPRRSRGTRGTLRHRGLAQFRRRLRSAR